MCKVNCLARRRNECRMKGAAFYKEQVDLLRKSERQLTLSI